MNSLRSPSQAPRAARFTAMLVAVALCALTNGCASNERAYEDVVAVDRRNATRVDSAAVDVDVDVVVDAATDVAAVTPLDRSTVDEYARRAARAFSFMRTCSWPPRTIRAQSLFLQFAAGFDAVFQRYVDCALRSDTCTQYGSCIVGGHSAPVGACWGDIYYNQGHSDIYECGSLSRGQAQCSERGCNDVRRCPAISFGARCEGDFVVNCQSVTLPVVSCPDVHPALRCVESTNYASCDIPDAPASDSVPGWTCDGTVLVQRSQFPFGWLHSQASLLARARETRFDCARLGLRCDPNGACVDPSGECTFLPINDLSAQIGPDGRSYRHCFGGRWYSFAIPPQS